MQLFARNAFRLITENAIAIRFTTVEISLHEKVNNKAMNTSWSISKWIVGEIYTFYEVSILNYIIFLSEKKDIYFSHAIIATLDAVFKIFYYCISNWLKN